MRVLVTGADGFVGGWLCRTLVAAGHRVTGTMVALDRRLPDDGLEWHHLELTDAESVSALFRNASPWDAIVHLGAIAWSRDAGVDPGRTWNVNAGGTVRLLEAVGRLREAGAADPLVLLVSSAEVYGRGQGLRTESDPPAPLSPYASSKLGAEVAAGEAERRLGLRVIVARPFPHIGPGQREVFVAPALLARIRAAKISEAREIPTGDLSTVRDFLDVRDVAAAYLALLERGAPGTIYNVASGTGQPLTALFDSLARRGGASVRPRPEPTLMRPWDVPHLVGDASRLRAATGWSPSYSFEQTLTDLVNAEAY